MSAHLSGKYNVCLKSNCNDAQGPYRGLVTTRKAHMGAQSHISPDLSHEHHTVLQEISPIPDRWDPSNGGKEEPNETLAYQRMTNIATCEKHGHPTCLHIRRPSSETPGSLKPRQSKPMSMMRSKAMSVVSVMIILSFVMWILVISQRPNSGIHEARIWK